MKNMIVRLSILYLLVTGHLLAEEFYGYYTHIDSKEAFEKPSRTGAHGDITVRIGDGRLVFWRGKSYLPYWQSPKGKWSLEEVVPRNGDGTDEMPDRVNAFTHVDLVKNEAEEVVVEWRYLPEFKRGNPVTGKNPLKVVEETFTISPSGKVVRIIKKGTSKLDDWNDPLNRTEIHLQLSEDGIKTLKRVEPSKRNAAPVKVEGKPIKGQLPIKPDLHWSFDEGAGDLVKESISGKQVAVLGHKTFWKQGVSGTAIAFDGYSTAVAAKADMIPEKLEGLTCSAWFAIGAYPWGNVPLFQKGDEKGIFLGLNKRGQPTLSANVNGSLETITLEATSERKRWYHLTGVVDGAGGKLQLYLNGELVQEKTVQAGDLQTPSSPIKIGKGAPRLIESAHRKNLLNGEYGYDGLIDEVAVYRKALAAEDVRALYRHYRPMSAEVNSPDMPKRALPTFKDTGTFGARYTHLKFYETWDALWRFGPNPDVVVEFENSPNKYVFWHGTGYIPHMVNGAGYWLTNEFNETRRRPEGEGCLEPMSDKKVFNNHARIIENTPARVVIHWRFTLQDVGHVVADFNYDTGWGDWSDWYFYIYPDGVVSKFMHIYTTGKFRHEFQESIILTGPDQRPDDILGKDPFMSLVDLDGKTTSIPYSSDAKKSYWNNVVHVLNFKEGQDPFSIASIKEMKPIIIPHSKYKVSDFTYFTHWPVAQIPSDHIDGFRLDRTASSSLGWLVFGYYQANFNSETFTHKTGHKRSYAKVMLEGLSDRKPEELLGLATSWLHAPSVTDPKGCYSKDYITHDRPFSDRPRVPKFPSTGYHKHERAYHLVATEPELSFTIAATPEQPIENLAFKIFNWSHNETGSVTLNGKSLGASCKQGIVRDQRGRQALVVFITHTSTEPALIRISGAKPEKTSEFTADSAKATIGPGADKLSVRIEADLSEEVTSRRFMFECTKGRKWNSGWQVENGVHLRDKNTLEPDTEYTFRVKVMDLYGNESPWYELTYKTPR